MRHSNRDSMKPNLALASLKDALSRESDRNLKYQEWILTHSAFDRPPRDVSMNELVKGSLETTITPGSSLPNPHSLQGTRADETNASSPEDNKKKDPIQGREKSFLS